MQSLSVKYRPQTFDEVVSQKSLIKILEKQVETNSFSNCMIFSGPSGCGKTTLARILANKINKGKGEPIEIDAASNNSVENVRSIIDSAVERSLDSEYKIFILDEAHMITTAGWNAFLKTIEEPPKHTLFMFCTTDFQKIPLTISNRCQVFKIGRINLTDIISRLKFICKQEGFVEGDGIDYIAKLSSGSLRQAISYLDVVKDFNNEISSKNVISCLGNYSYDVFISLTNSIIDNDSEKTITLIENIYNEGTDLVLFIDNYFNFILQVLKYIIFKDISTTTLPIDIEEDIKYIINIDNAYKWYASYLNKILDIKKTIKFDNDAKTTIEVMFICK